MPVKSERGYLIVATNTDTVNYIDCAIACATSIRLHTPDAKIALLSDAVCPAPIFDYSIEFPYAVDPSNPFANDWQVFAASPFRETIKIEADMIIPHSIDHWWTMLRHKDVVLTLGARNYLNEATSERHYRKIFDSNDLPDVYNAITYWRLSRQAKEFFDLVHDIFENWETVKTQIKFGNEDVGSTDLVYAIAAKLIGVENVTLPNTSYPSLIHMKGRINFLQSEDWTKEMVWELDGSNIRINTIDQQYPFHYNVKDFSKILNEYYDKYPF
jgi:hypothetical protein